MSSDEIKTVDDGLGGCYVIEAFPKRSAVNHRDALGRSRSLAAFYGPAARDFAVEWVEGVIARRSKGPERCSPSDGAPGPTEVFEL
jgi:hypothetical protein